MRKSESRIFQILEFEFFEKSKNSLFISRTCSIPIFYVAIQANIPNVIRHFYFHFTLFLFAIFIVYCYCFQRFFLIYKFFFQFDITNFSLTSVLYTLQYLDITCIFEMSRLKFQMLIIWSLWMKSSIFPLLILLCNFTIAAANDYG